MSDTSATRPMYAPAVPPSDRPVSPHLQIWRWTVTMASSILQRATGVALYGGYILLAAYLACAAAGEASYNFAKGIAGSPLGIIALVGFTWAQMFHLSKGILHLLWDGGNFIGKEAGQRSAIIVFLASFALTAAIWIAAIAMKG